MPLQDLTRTMVHLPNAIRKTIPQNLGKRHPKGLKIAIPKEFYAEGIDDEVRNAVMQAARTYGKNGSRTGGMQHAQSEIRCCSILSDCFRRGFFQPVPLRRHQIWSPQQGRRHIPRTDLQLQKRRLRQRSKTPYFRSEIMLCPAVTMMHITERLWHSSSESPQNMHTFSETCDVILTPTTPVCCLWRT